MGMNVASEKEKNRARFYLAYAPVYRFLLWWYRTEIYESGNYAVIKNFMTWEGLPCLVKDTVGCIWQNYSRVCKLAYATYTPLVYNFCYLAFLQNKLPLLTRNLSTTARKTASKWHQIVLNCRRLSKGLDTREHLFVSAKINYIFGYSALQI